MQNPAAPTLELSPDAPPAMAAWRGASFAVDARRFGGAVGIATLISVGHFLLLPRVLEVATYGAFRIFLVYAVYAGVLHLGLPDGAYVRWAGRDRGQILLEWRHTASWLAMVQLSVLAAFLIIAVAIEDTRLAVTVAGLGAFIPAANFLTLNAATVQATGEFRRAGLLAVMPPAAILLGVLAIPAPLRTLPMVLAITVAAQALPAALSGAWLHLASRSAAAEARSDAAGAGTVTPRALLRLGVPVLAANIVAGLALSVDRLLLSVTTSVEQFAMYGFAASAFVVANAATQGISRVSVPHAARLPVAARGEFYAQLYRLLAAGFGLGLGLYPAVESTVEAFLPAYTPAIAIMRALLPGALYGVALHVVVYSALLVRQAVHTQLALAAMSAGIALAATATAILLRAPLWGVAAASSAGLGLAWIVSTGVSARRAPVERPAGLLRFVLCTTAQLVALAIALGTTNGVVTRTAAYLTLAALPTFLAWRRAP